MTNLAKSKDTVGPNHRLDHNGGKFVIPPRKDKNLIDFMMMSTQQVLDTFAALPNSEKVGEGDRQFIYIPGNREDKALLVAHADTVWDDKDLNLGAYNDELFSVNNQLGVGADDRAGIAILWHLKDLGHSLLIPNKEERGCIGSRFLMTDEKWRKIINSHNFAIEFDRRGNNDLVFYRVGSREYTDWCEKNFEGFKHAFGSFTDICVLCDESLHKEDALCGLNISVGYYDQHFHTEYLNLKEWNHTLSITKKVLSQAGLPKFRHKYYQYTSGDYSDCDLVDLPETVRSRVQQHRQHILSPVGKAITESENMSESLVCCVFCTAIMDVTEYTALGNKCTHCRASF